MSISLSNWFIIYPHEVKDVIKKEFDKLNLKDFTVSIILIKDELSEDEKNEYVDFINKNLRYNGYINTSYEKDLIDTVESMGGVGGDVLYILKKGKIICNKLKF